MCTAAKKQILEILAAMNTTELVVVQGTKLRLDYHRWQTFEYMKWALKL